MRVDDWHHRFLWMNLLQGIFRLEHGEGIYLVFLRRALHQLCFFDVLFQQA